MFKSHLKHSKIQRGRKFSYLIRNVHSYCEVCDPLAESYPLTAHEPRFSRPVIPVLRSFGSTDSTTRDDLRQKNVRSNNRLSRLFRWNFPFVFPKQIELSLCGWMLMTSYVTSWSFVWLCGPFPLYRLCCYYLHGKLVSSIFPSYYFSYLPMHYGTFD